MPSTPSFMAATHRRLSMYLHRAHCSSIEKQGVAVAVLQQVRFWGATALATCTTILSAYSLPHALALTS